MKTKGLKIVDKKRKLAQRLLETANLIEKYSRKTHANFICPFQLSESVPVIGNFKEYENPEKYRTKMKMSLFMAFKDYKDYWKKENRRKYYKNKIKSI